MLNIKSQKTALITLITSLLICSFAVGCGSQTPTASNPPPNTPAPPAQLPSNPPNPSVQPPFSPPNPPVQPPFNPPNLLDLFPIGSQPLKIRLPKTTSTSAVQITQPPVKRSSNLLTMDDFEKTRQYTGTFEIPVGTINFELIIAGVVPTETITTFISHSLSFSSITDPNGREIIDSNLQWYMNYSSSTAAAFYPTTTVDTNRETAATSVPGTWHYVLSYTTQLAVDDQVSAVFITKNRNTAADQLTITPIIFGQNSVALNDYIGTVLLEVVQVFQNVGLKASLATPIFTNSVWFDENDTIAAIKKYGNPMTAHIVIVGPMGTLGQGVGGLSSAGGAWGAVLPEIGFTSAVYPTTNQGFEFHDTAVVIAHELLHFLGLGHPVNYFTPADFNWFFGGTCQPPMGSMFCRVDGDFLEATTLSGIHENGNLMDTDGGTSCGFVPVADPQSLRNFSTVCNDYINRQMQTNGTQVKYYELIDIQIQNIRNNPLYTDYNLTK